MQSKFKEDNKRQKDQIAFQQQQVSRLEKRLEDAEAQKIANGTKKVRLYRRGDC